jgi:MGT family glycosyltransferase
VKFLFCSLASPGFLNPFIGIALELAERGHSVAFVTDVTMGEQLARQGLERIPLGQVDKPSFHVPIWSHRESIADQLRHVFYAIQRFRPDILVAQPLTLGPIMTAEVRKLPLAILGFCTYLWPDSQSGSEKPLSQIESLKEWRYGDMLRLYNNARQLLSLSPCIADCREAPFLGDLFMVRSISELEKNLNYLPEQVHLVGHCLWEESSDDPELEAWLRESVNSGAPIVYVQHGRFFDRPSFWPNLIAGLAGLNVKVAASVGRMDHAIGEVPPNFLVRHHMPELRVLDHANAMIASANSTAVLGALSKGVPSILVPAGGEQPDVAARCEAMGVAKVLAPEQSDPAELSAALQQILVNRKMLDTCQWMAKAFGQIDGFKVAANLLEALAETSAPVLRYRKSSSLNEAMA